MITLFTTLPGAMRRLAMGLRPMRRSLAALALPALLLPLLGGCSGIDPHIYAQQQPTLNLTRYFDRPMVGHGMVRDRSGAVIRRFVVDITPRDDAGNLILDERFRWSDGEREQRIWTLRPQPDGTWQGTANGVVGTAQGVLSGNALNFRYTFDLPVGDTRYHVQFDDWMYLIDESTLLNHAEISKFGIRMADVFISFQRPATGEPK